MIKVKNSNSDFKGIEIVDSYISSKEELKLVLMGHKNHGKSTIIGRLLEDTDSLSKGKLDNIKKIYVKNSKNEQIEYTTTDSIRCFLETEKRRYIITDALCHTEFLKNMVEGDSRADAALLVIDVNEGIKENSLRDIYILSMLGVKQVTILINKMDLVDYDRKVYRKVVNEFIKFINKIDVIPKSFIPVSAVNGDNVVNKTGNMSWYKGNTVLEELNSFSVRDNPVDKPFRMPVKDIYEFTKDGENKRIISGTIASGKIKAGDEIVFYPSGKKSIIKTIEKSSGCPQNIVEANCQSDFTLSQDVHIKRGELTTKLDEKKPHVTTRVRANLLWLGKNQLQKDKKYVFKIGSLNVKMVVEKINKIIDIPTLELLNKEEISKNDAAECILRLDNAVSFDIDKDIIETNRFIVFDDYNICGGGLILEALEDKQSWVRDKVIIRNNKWEENLINYEERAKKYMQNPILIIINGDKSSETKDIAKFLEKELFDRNKLVYYLGIENFLYGVNADLNIVSDSNNKEYMRRFAEVSNIILETGLILVMTLGQLSCYDLDIIKTTINNHNLIAVWIGDKSASSLEYDLYTFNLSKYEIVQKIILLLEEKKIF